MNTKNQKITTETPSGQGGVIGSACSKCGMSDFEIKFQPINTKIYWSQHDEIENIKKFTRNDDYYSSDSINKECLIRTCKTCGHKKAIPTADR